MPYRSVLFVVLLAVTVPSCGSGNAPHADDGAYEGMAPSGKTVGALLAISSHLSILPEPSWTRDFEIEKLSQAGVRLLRTDFAWDRIEPEDDQWSFDGYDVMVDQCVAAGIQVDALLDYGVDWAMTDGTDNGIDPAVWADFNGRVAAHFADRIDTYEIWNEQNTDRFWSPEPDPEHYGRLLKAGYDAIHANDPDAVVLFGGLSDLDPYIFGPDGVWNFLIRTADAHPDICGSFDAMAIHPYTFLQQPMPEKRLSIGASRFPDLEQSIDQARSLLLEIGCPDKPIHLTEIGWPDLLIGTERQAAYLARGLLLAAGKGVESYYWYTFWDGDGSDPLPTEDAFGLFTWPGNEVQEKPDYRALLAADRILGESRYAGDLGKVLGWPEEQRALVFKEKGGTWTLGLWHAVPRLNESVSVSVPLPPRSSGRWELYSQEGLQVRDGDTAPGKVDLTITGRVLYLRFHVK